MTTWTSPRAGTVYAGDRLMLFRARSIVVVKPWPPMAWLKTATQTWRGCRPELKLDIAPLEARLANARQDADEPPGETSREVDAEAAAAAKRHIARLQYEYDAWRQFNAEIPGDLHRLVAPFAERHYAVLSMLARCPGAVDLVASNPVLGLLIATNWIWRRPPVKQPMRAARRLVRLKRRDILEWLGFPGTGSAVRILAKYPASFARVKHLFYLRQAMHNPEALRRLGFLNRINAGVIRIASDPALLRCTAPNLLEEISVSPEDDRRGALGWLVANTAEMYRNLGLDIAGLRIRSLEHLLHLGPALDLEMADVSAAAMLVPAFPPPPVQPVPGFIEHIATPDELRAEAQRMTNCVETLAPSLVHRRVYLFRVLLPERATLSIKFEAGRWMIEDCLAARNRSVRQATLCAAASWLAQEQELEPHQVVRNELVGTLSRSSGAF